MTNILIVLEEFIAVDRTKRSFRLREKDKMLINQQFAIWLYKAQLSPFVEFCPN